MTGKKSTVRVSKPAAGKKLTSSRAKADSTTAEREQWATLRPSMKVEQAKDYDMDGTYQNKALVRHAMFGLGVVTNVAGSHKMEVLFEEGKKLLRCH